MGCVEHGKKIIQKFSVLLDEFPDFLLPSNYSTETLIPSYGQILLEEQMSSMKRFEQTRLSRREQRELAHEIARLFGCLFV